MTQILEQLIRLLNVKKLEDGKFSGLNADIGLPRVYGGQVLGQAIIAASRSIDHDKYRLHSLHSYFLKIGNPQIPIIFEVDNIRDGSSFCTRRVIATQNNIPIFNLSCSFHIDEPGLEHQLEKIKLPRAPELLSSMSDYLNDLAIQIPQLQSTISKLTLPIDVRPIDFLGILDPRIADARAMSWIKPIGKVPDKQILQQAVAAFMSDMELLSTAARPHGVNFLQPGIMAASLDHSMWFHREINCNEWLLYVKDSPIASGARAFTRGSIYDLNGQLVASTTQEGLIRTEIKK